MTRVIATAGHVDHGKSTLVAALTGMNPDRLKEERERQMTIDLGFAWLTLPNGQEAGIVDVPGHRDFIENMLAGVGGVDAALLVIAADEGVMPQTREHLAILHLLGVERALVALTKIDRAPDPDWLELVQEDIRRALTGTTLADAPIVPVSARTGQGIETLLQALAALLDDLPPRPDLGRARLPIDRIFTLPGFGVIVTGTLGQGSLQTGQEVEILPRQIRARIRGLQSHKRERARIAPGARAAVNLNGVDLEDLRRSDTLCAPGAYTPTRRADVRLTLLPDLAAPLKHAARVKVFAAASESLAVVRLLEADSLPAGAQAWAQLEFLSPLTLTRGDRLIVRRPSPAETLGGALVIDSAPRKRHRRLDAATLKALETLRRGDPLEGLVLAAQRVEAASGAELALSAGIDPAEAAELLARAEASGGLIRLSLSAAPSSDDLWMSALRWGELRQQVRQALEDFHRQNPLKRGMPRETLRARLKVSTRVWTAALRRLEITSLQGLLALPEHEIRLSPQEQALAETWLRRLSAGLSTPPVKECQAGLGPELYAALLERGDLVQVSAEVVFERGVYLAALETLKRAFAQRGSLTAAEARDLLVTSRKYVLALLEHLDSLGLTRRVGEGRVMRQELEIRS